jgi:radical SAM superfamily enzyme YgiQ (UPF0313 family)
MNPHRILLLDINRVALDTSADMLEYPLGLLYVATSLRAAFGSQIDVRILSYHDRPNHWSPIEEALDTFRPQILGLRALTMGRAAMHRIATLAKEKFGVPVILAGGPHATHCPEDVVANPAFACAVLGEGERTAVDLVACLLAGQPIDAVPGIALPSPTGVRLTPPRPLIEDLDSLPIPEYDLVDFTQTHRGYVDFSFRRDIPHANLFSSRGCPYRCIYCHKVFGKTFRPHSPERTLTEMRILYERHGIRNFQILDDIFNIDRRRAMRFFELLIASGMDVVISFPNGLRGDRIDAEMIDAMWDAGVRYIAYAIESGSPRIQRLIQKDLDLDRIAEAIALSNARGILTRGFFMLGFPTETEAEARMTVEFAKASDLAAAMFFTVVYFPGTPLYRLAQEMCDLSDYDLALEDDYVHTREGPYAFSRATLEQIKLDALREFCFSPKRLRLFFERMPTFYNQRDIDASLLANIISARMREEEVPPSPYAGELHRRFLIAQRFSEKSGFFV